VVVREDHVGTWPDAEDIGKAILRAVEIDGRPIERVGRETAAGRDLEGGTIRIERIGGAPDRNELSDNPLLELAMFGVGVEQVKAIRTAVWRAMKAAEGEHVALDDGTQVYLHSARIESGPIRPPWSVETSTRRGIENWRLSYPPLLTG
jgi:hypothetical protein